MRHTQTVSVVGRNGFSIPPPRKIQSVARGYASNFSKENPQSIFFSFCFILCGADWRCSLVQGGFMNPSNPIRLSLAMTTYNAEVYLIEQLESIRLQTMPFDEVVIVDDASRDHTVEKIREYIATYHLAGRWFLHVHTENTGFVRAFRDALSRTRGEYIFLSDHDDIWKPEKVEHMMKMFDKHVELLALASSFSLIDAQDRPIEGKSSSRRSNHNLIRRPLPRGQFSWLTFEDLMGYNVSPGCTLALTRRLKDEYLSTPVDMNLPHDWAICAIAAIQNGLGYLDEELMGYRQHPGNTLGLTRRSDYESRLHASWQDYLQKEALLEIVLFDHLVPELYEEGRLPFILVLDGITDVRNFGAIARTAECVGADAIVIPEHGSVSVGGDAIKTSAGALHHIPVCRERSAALAVRFLKENGYKVVAVTEKAEINYTQIDYTVPVALVMGAEDVGISPEVLKLTDEGASIPMFGEIGSLNVSVAAGVMMYEVVRQRLLANLEVI